ncbi:hypothetical protein FPOAC2_05373 [Fusarium poae]|uniref:Ecp2 effector protein domain-containing protein n=1 Tax=Fusarium poae TaxID=36050 RepID=A0A1B8AUK7_FUSPO|nr:hypothetical protein FPOAC1_005266 [Fusarium poae]KAG8672007.1 hypothetical protein FPOAC1_005266 [Fusarium poae]OBS24223.1 hypothetical protein FPOA_04770 [Fusarium poae]
MHALSTLTTLTMSLFAAQTANAWLLEFWGTQNVCSKPKGSAADNSAGGNPGEGNDCMMAYYDLEAMLVKDWDEGCTVRLYNGKGFNCDGDLILEYTKEKAEEEEKLSDDGTYMCLTDLAGEPGPYQASYTCE